MNLIDCEYRVLFVWGWAYLGTCPFSNCGTLVSDGRELAGGKGKTDSNFSTVSYRIIAIGILFQQYISLSPRQLYATIES